MSAGVPPGAHFAPQLEIEALCEVWGDKTETLANTRNSVKKSQNNFIDIFFH